MLYYKNIGCAALYGRNVRLCLSTVSISPSLTQRAARKKRDRGGGGEERPGTSVKCPCSTLGPAAGSQHVSPSSTPNPPPLSRSLACPRRGMEDVERLAIQSLLDEDDSFLQPDADILSRLPALISPSLNAGRPAAAPIAPSVLASGMSAVALGRMASRRSQASQGSRGSMLTVDDGDAGHFPDCAPQPESSDTQDLQDEEVARTNASLLETDESNRMGVVPAQKEGLALLDGMWMPVVLVPESSVTGLDAALSPMGDKVLEAGPVVVAKKKKRRKKKADREDVKDEVLCPSSSSASIQAPLRPRDSPF